MTVLRGAVWDGAGFFEGWVETSGSTVVSVGHGAPPSAARVTGVILPSLVNAHTHVADRLARGKIPPDARLEEVVAPPLGLKHRLLAAASADETERAIRAAIDEARLAGSRTVFDFREGGREGVSRLSRARDGSDVEAIALGRLARPSPFDAREADALLDSADGVGISGLGDAPFEAIAALAARSRARGKRVAIHWSEGARESVDQLLDLAPDFAVHAVRATQGDLARIADARVPLVTCPRSNARLVGALPDFAAMREAGVELCIGSDNAMLQSVSVVDEMAFLLEHSPFTPAEIVRMAVDVPRARLDLPRLARSVEPGADARDLVVFAAKGPNPYASLFGGGETLQFEA